MINLLFFLTLFLVPFLFIFLVVFTLVVWYLQYVGIRLWYGRGWRLEGLRRGTRMVIADVIGCLNVLWWWIGVVLLICYHFESMAIDGNGYGRERESFIWGLGEFAEIPDWWVFLFPFGLDHFIVVGVLILIGKVVLLWLRRHYGDGSGGWTSY